MSDLVKLERILIVNIKDMELLKEALTHKSYAAERSLQYDNQRLEFLGDAVVQILITEHLFSKYPACDEGELTMMRAALAKQESLASLARRLPLDEFIMLGKGELEAGGQNRDSTLSDAFEALIGAIYLDRGLDTARRILIGLISETYPEPSTLLDDLNPKGSLQEYTQQHFASTPDYRVIEVAGPDHDPSYTVEVSINGESLAHGSAAKRKNAESAAAKIALQRLLSDNSPFHKPPQPANSEA